jgi:hypothetical protein
MAGGKLLQISTVGGANEVLCDKFEAVPGTTNRDGTILAWTPPPTKVFSVSRDDCTLRARSPSDTAEVGYSYPHFLPDGNHFLFAAVRKNRHNEVLLGSLSDSKTQVLIRNASYPKYVASGYILFSRDGYLMAQKYDAASNRTSGEPFLAYPNQLFFFEAFGYAEFDVSRNGTLAAQEQVFPPMVLRWYDRAGHVQKTLGEPEFANAPRLDAEQSHVLMFLSDPRTHEGDMWSLDLEHGTRKRFTFYNRSGVGWGTWTRDAERIVYSVLDGRAEMFIKNTGSSGNGQRIETGLEESKYIGDVTGDGKRILFAHEIADGMEIYGQALDGGKPFLIGRSRDEVLRLSPDGEWVAFVSTQFGSSEIAVRPFAPGTEADTQVSFGGGQDPRWSRDGKELYYRTNDWHLVAVPVVNLKQHRFGKPVTLFQVPEGSEYDVADGKRFLVNEPVGGAAAPLFVIANWSPGAAQGH